MRSRSTNNIHASYIPYMNARHIGAAFAHILERPGNGLTKETVGQHVEFVASAPPADPP